MAKETEYSPLQELKAAIKNGTPANFYVFHGEEMFLLNHYLEQLKKSVLDELTESFNYHRFNGETFDLHSFADSVENLPMMAERTLVEVDDVDIFQMDEDSRLKIAEILSDIPEYCVVVFTYETVQWKPEKKTKHLFEAVQSAKVLNFEKQNQRELVSWITRHFAAQKKQITPDLCAYLIEITDGTMTTLAGEIQKISAYSGADQICKADIDAVTEPALDAMVYQLTDRIGTGDYAGALQLLQTLFKMQEKPIGLLAAIGAHLRRISTARVLQEHGKGPEELRKLYPTLKEYPAKKCIQSARRFSPGFLAVAAELIMETDHQMKSSYDDPQRLLELVILRLAQEARNG